MAIETNRPLSLGPKAFLAHLRDHPDARFKPPRELAQEFDLTTEFVEEVLTKAESPVAGKPAGAQTFYRELSSLNRRLKRLMDDSAKHPTAFVVGTSLLAQLILVMLSLIKGQSLINLHQRGVDMIVVTGPGVVIPFLMVCAQMVLFFRRGNIRFAFYGALAFWIVGGAGLAWVEWAENSSLRFEDRLNLCILIVIGHLVVSLVYATAGAFIALMGEYRKVMRENRRIEKMSRQELIERLFQLQARMEMAKTSASPKPRKRKLTAYVKSRLFISAAVLGFVLGLGINVAVGDKLATLLSINNQNLPGAFTILISFSVGVLMYVANFWLAYLAPNLKTALVVGAIYAVGALLAKLLWVPFQLSHAHREREIIFIYLSVVGTPLRDLIIAAVAGILGAIQTRALDELNIQRNDEATLIAEQLKIQWRLSENTCSTTVLVADVVKSTQMKDGADPLKVEYSFRRLQQWIEDISASHGGAVRSTAGDSAVVSFPNCHSAFMAATELQRRMPDFNQNWNRLETPFRVRCGIHVGEVQGDLGKIQFAQVIDLAAHLQKMAPSGGIAATQEVVTSIGAAAFVPLAVKSDGHDVFLAMDPTGP